MPNHVYNEITLKGVDFEKAKKVILNDDSEVDFAVLLPLPKNYWPGSVSIKHEESFPGTHLNAAREIWGTKWGAYGDPKLVDTPDGPMVSFKTAWDHPRGWVCALFNTFNCDIHAEYLSEGWADGARETWGQAKPDDMMTPTWNKEAITEGTDDHKRLHKGLWGVEQFDDDE